MGIYIKSLEMPISCSDCPCGSIFSGYRCMAENKEFEKYPLDSRQDWCPLVPVPPHYDLIDHNALKIAVMDCDAETRIDFLKHAMDCINKAPVVIPSDIPTYEVEEGE